MQLLEFVPKRKKNYTQNKNYTLSKVNTSTKAHLPNQDDRSAEEV